MVKITIGKIRTNYTGEMERDRIYEKLDAVYYNGATYISKKESNNSYPPPAHSGVWLQGWTDGKDLFLPSVISNKTYKDY